MSHPPKSPALHEFNPKGASPKDKASSSDGSIAEIESRGFEYGVLHWRSKAEGSLLQQIEQSLSLSPEQILALVDLGAVYDSNGRMTNPERLYVSSPALTYLRLHTKPRRFDVNFDWTERVVASTADFVIVNKPAGVPCHPTVDNIKENLISSLRQALGCEIYITHRLDIGTSGLILLAKTKSFQSAFNLELQQGRVTKYYETLVQGLPSWPENTILTHWLKPSPRAPKEMANQQTLGWAECRLKILSCSSRNSFEGFETMIKIELLTGRTHQIRAQLAAEGFPLMGDAMYGATPRNPPGFFLQSHFLRFEHQGQICTYGLAPSLSRLDLTLT